MKKLSVFDKLVFLINSLFATMLLLSYVLPFIEPKRFAFLAVLSLGVPFLILVNILFMIYWLLKVKKQLLLSLIVLLLGFSYLTSLYKFSSTPKASNSSELVIMNYNVRLFNVFKWIPNINATQRITQFIKKEDPDIIAMQEYRSDPELALDKYYKFESLAGHKIKNGQAIFSKFPIINKGSIEFPNTYNNAIFVDVVKGMDTIRIYNVHLQSLKIDASSDPLKMESSGNLFKRVGKTFSMQQRQVDLFLEHRKSCTYKTIVCADLNNTAYSYVYKDLKGDFKDAFVEQGNGFGRSFDFKFFPVRIDFILVDNHFQVNDFKTFDVKYSDHFPIMTKLEVQ